MQNDPKKIPMTRINERAPEEKWMRNTNAQPGPVGQHGVIDATMLGDVANPPRPEPLPPKGVGSPNTAQPVDAQVPLLEQQKSQLQTEKAAAEQEARDRKAESEALGEKLQQLRGDLKQANANGELLKKRISELEDANDTTELQAKLDAAMARIKELEAQKPEVKEVEKEVEVEVEVYPRRVILSEVTNVRKKGDNLIVKGTVDMGEGEEDHNVILRIPFDEVAEVIKGA